MCAICMRSAGSAALSIPEKLGMGWIVSLSTSIGTCADGNRRLLQSLARFRPKGVTRRRVAGRR